MSGQPGAGAVGGTAGGQAAEFHMLVPGTAETVIVPAAEVPGDWYVYRADPLGSDRHTVRA